MLELLLALEQQKIKRASQSLHSGKSMYSFDFLKTSVILWYLREFDSRTPLIPKSAYTYISVSYISRLHKMV